MKIEPPWRAHAQQWLQDAAQHPLLAPPAQTQAAQHTTFTNPAAQEARDARDAQWRGWGWGWREDQWQQDAAVAQIQQTTQQWREAGGKGKDAQGKRLDEQQSARTTSRQPYR